MLGEASRFIRLANPMYSRVMDYDTVHMTPWFNNKSLACHDFFMKKISKVFSRADLTQFNQFCAQSLPVEIQERRTNDHVSREYLFRPNVMFHPVHFNEQGIPCVDVRGKHTPSSLLNPELTFPATIDKCILVGLERFGREMGWRNVTKEIGCDVVRSRLPAQETITLLDWHFDFQTAHSFVITLDNPQGTKRGWEGGRFYYAAEATVSDIFLRTLFQNGYAATRDSTHPTWSLFVDQNEGVLFSNQRTLHFVSPMKAYSEDNSPVSRTILTFFEKNESEEGAEGVANVQRINHPQPIAALSEFLHTTLAAYALPVEVQEQTMQFVASLEELAQTINRYKRNPQLFYDCIQAEKQKMRQIAESLADAIAPYDKSGSSRQIKQIKEKIVEWIYNS